MQEIYQLCIIEAAWQIRPPVTIPDFTAVSCGETIRVAVDASDNVPALLAVQEAHAYIHPQYVHPGAQDQGLGRALLQHLHLAFPWQRKCVANNQAGMVFYRGLGWRELEIATAEDASYCLLQFA
ncbi:GNAT family N-acetyltransferase [Undibacterium sp. Ji42W]|uniref:GNAT family N-acetyltransferase n=1 Tax=Undibacterium sp. Ji42W TaxID=3413039 RepID=UPI003BF340AD